MVPSSVRVNFASDYNNGAHPEILQRLCALNEGKHAGYGEDIYCQHAAEKIRRICQAPDADVFFLMGGTQTNAVVIHALLHQTEGVISADTGHIHVHEAGAIEATGHRVISLPQYQGKLKALDVAACFQAFENDASRDHVVAPGMVYISQPTEFGTLYTLNELEALAEVCRRYDVPLYMDGARLGYALASPQCDMTMADIARLCDAFYIGGTKQGALCGEAVVFPCCTPKRFKSSMKQHGALLAKGHLIGIQFDTLFENHLYFDMSHHAICMAQKMIKVFEKYHLPFYLLSPTNQQFILLKNKQVLQLSSSVDFTIWDSYDDEHKIVRFITSWATTEDEIERLAECIQDLSI